MTPQKIISAEGKCVHQNLRRTLKNETFPRKNVALGRKVTRFLMAKSAILFITNFLLKQVTSGSLLLCRTHKLHLS
jgi:hypothetical protein